MDKKTIIIDTRDFGKQEIQEETVITFPNGIFAFESITKYALLSPLGEEASPMWLQNIESPAPCFIVFKPKELLNNYEPILSEDDLKVIQYEDGEKLEFLSIAVIPEDYKKTTINLKSPIVINRNKAIAIQVILQSEYQIKFPIFESLKEG